MLLITISGTAIYNGCQSSAYLNNKLRTSLVAWVGETPGIFTIHANKVFSWVASKPFRAQSTLSQASGYTYKIQWKEVTNNTILSTKTAKDLICILHSNIMTMTTSLLWIAPDRYVSMTNVLASWALSQKKDKKRNKQTLWRCNHIWFPWIHNEWSIIHSLLLLPVDCS